MSFPLECEIVTDFFGGETVRNSGPRPWFALPALTQYSSMRYPSGAVTVFVVFLPGSSIFPESIGGQTCSFARAEPPMMTKPIARERAPMVLIALVLLEPLRPERPHLSTAAPSSVGPVTLMGQMA